MSPFSGSRPRFPFFCTPVFLTVVAGTIFLCIDLPRQGASITPLLAICWILGMSMRLHPQIIRFVIVVMMVFVFLSMIGKDWDLLALQVVGVFAAGIIAILYSSNRLRTHALTEQLRILVEQAPAGLIIADPMGCILSASKDIKNLLGKRFGSLEGHSFSDVLMCHLPPGEAMRIYIEWFRREGSHKEDFCLRDHPEALIPGHVFCSGTGATRIMIASLRLL